MDGLWRKARGGLESGIGIGIGFIEVGEGRRGGKRGGGGCLFKKNGFSL